MGRNEREIIVHIGFPKTGTTTLQKALFPSLHRKGYIFYAGKWHQDSREGQEINSGLYQGVAERIRWDNKKNTPLSLETDLKKVVISEEGFTSPQGISKIATQHFKDYGIGYVPNTLATAIREHADKIKILITIRNQKSMIPSFYAQNFWVLKYEDGILSWEDLFEDCTKDNDLYQIWHYDQLCDTYASVFGEGALNVLFYEDLLYDKDVFIQSISRALEVDATVVEESLGREKFNVRQKEGTLTIRKAYRSRNGYRVWKLIAGVLYMQKENLLGRVLQKVYKRWRKSEAQKFYQKTMYKSVALPDATEEQKERIFNYYRGSNLKLVGKYGIEEEKLKRYGYI